uniref:Uncharacterized protein n=1 Tax=Anguilla anguilla TaxID=7936 RepID=A0A0E9V329_ANGAN
MKVPYSHPRTLNQSQQLTPSFSVMCCSMAITLPNTLCYSHIEKVLYK